VTLEDLKPGVRVRGVVPQRAVEVVQARSLGTEAVELTYKDADGRVGQELVFRADADRLELDGESAGWRFTADARLFRLASEALRIRLAYLFDPYLAVHASNLEALPHQIEAVYGEMLPRQPLRFLLADDPGAGKTIMAGLLIKELVVRGDVKRCLIVCPGSLVEQWQDELWQKLQLEFDMVSRETIENSRSGNPFAEKSFVIARLDQLSRSDDVRAKLEQTEWDLVIVDEAHKMSAHYYGLEVKETKRYNLGRLLGSISRHLLFLTATPHSGKDEDFRLFMRLLDPERFEGKPRKGDGGIDTRGMMRRLVKEKLLKFDGRPLFPERLAYTVTYELSPAEQSLYDDVTAYVRDEMNRAERLRAAGDGRRGAIVGFALTVLQRRLASSPQAIYRSLERRRERLERRLEDEQAGRAWRLPELDEEDIDELDERSEAELEEIEEQVVDEASAARTVEELRAEIQTLRRLEAQARDVRNAQTDRKWEELSSLLQGAPEMLDRDGVLRKLIVFTEHRDTLEYLTERIRTLLGRREAVVTIHGGLRREVRREAQEGFVQDPEVQVLVATDAAGEGVNLQRAHLLVNYDLPWNPNRIEQRFGRIHRIGQTEVCHMWNLVAAGTREGAVFERLFEKLKEQRRALGGQVFDVLGQVFSEHSLRDLLIEAVRHGEDPQTRAKLDEVVDAAVGIKLRQALRERALVSDVLTPADVEAIRERMEQAEARRLQPHFIRAFFLEAFREVGGQISRREPGRYEIAHVPAALRSRERGRSGPPVVARYERVTFEKELVNVQGKQQAQLLTPGHPLLDAVVDTTLDRHRPLLGEGSILVADADDSADPRALVYIEDTIQSGRTDASGNRLVVSRRLQFVELAESGEARAAGYAPYLDYRPPQDDEFELVASLAEAEWARGVEQAALEYAVRVAVPEHLDEVRTRTVGRVTKTVEAVRARLLAEINYWDARANQLKAQELAGRKPKLNSGRARQRADELKERLDRRMEELEQEKQIAPLPPAVVGAALVVPRGALERLRGEVPAQVARHARETKRVERAAVDAVLAAERRLGRRPKEMPPNNPGYDILSKDPLTGEILFIEVKGRVEGAPTFTITKNEILTALNKPDQFLLALVAVEGDSTNVRYLRKPFAGPEEIYFEMASADYKWNELFERGELPRRDVDGAVERWIGVAVERLAAQFQPLRIVLFGSHARGDATSDSDVDLLVVMPEVQNKRVTMVEMLRVLRGVPLGIDVIPTDPREIGRRGHLVGTILQPALSEGKVLYERAL